MTERRFTDRDVALILRRAVELDRRSPGESAARGLSAEDLRGIAAEVGIDPAMVTRAIAELQSRRGLDGAALLGPALVSREVRAVPTAADRDGLARLVRIVDQEIPAQGTVGEALGSVRWTAPGRLLSHQVSLEPSGEETIIRVEERYADRLRAILHGLPAAYGAMFGLAIGLEAIGGLAAGVLAPLGLGAVGWGLGGLIWRIVSARSQARVHALAERLSAEAASLPSVDASGSPDDDG